MTTEKLFAVYLGGHAKNATLEVHDVAFVIGPDVKATVPDLKKMWFGTPDSVHIDSWVELSTVDGYDILLSREKPSSALPKLFFVNVGSYGKHFGENHYFYFVVAKDDQEAKLRSKNIVAEKGDQLPHTDNLFEVDTVREISEVKGLNIHLRKSAQPKDLEITNLYWPLKNQ